MNKKKLGMTIGSLALVGAIAVGGTLAYLSDISDQVNNTFTMSDNVRIVLDEKNTDGTTPKRDQSNEYKNIVPDVVYDKDPTLTLLNTDLEQYAFMGIKNTTKEQVVTMNGETDGLNLANWEKVGTVEGVDIYVYYTNEGSKNYVVTNKDDTKDPAEESSGGYQAGIQLPALFTNVRLADNVPEVAVETNIGNIYVGAAAIQVEGLTMGEAYSQISQDLADLVNNMVNQG